MQTIQTSASILNADMCNLEAVVHMLEQSGTDMLHFDVMDGRFVNNISFGIPVLAAIRKKTNLFLDVHLMIADPLQYAARFAQAGANGITFHLESESDPQKTIDAIHACGIPVGIAIKPMTPAESVLPYLPSVEIGIGDDGGTGIWRTVISLGYARKGSFSAAGNQRTRVSHNDSSGWWCQCRNGTSSG